jgi:hypothetical protein
MESHGMAPIGMFEITRLGLPIAVVGLIYLVVAAPRLLPIRGPAFRDPEEGGRDFLVEMEVVPCEALDGASVDEGGLRGLEGVFLAEDHRPDEIVAPAAPTTVLRGRRPASFRRSG